MFRGRVGWNGLGGYGGLGPSVNTRLFGHSQLRGYGAYGGYEHMEHMEHMEDTVKLG